MAKISGVSMTLTEEFQMLFNASLTIYSASVSAKEEMTLHYAISQASKLIRGSLQEYAEELTRRDSR